MMGGLAVKLLRKLTAFILVFSLLAGTVAVMSAAVYTENAATIPGEVIAPEIKQVESKKADLSATAALSYTPRLTAPAKTNKYYYSDLNVFYKYGWGMPNCTCYAWGRAYEILGKAPNLSAYSAYLWYDYNKNNGFYPYGTTPKVGAIACWVYTSGTSGHVAVVEKVENNTITFSNSAYSGIEFYTNTAPVNDPSNGNKTWIFQGYIYLGDYVTSSSGTTVTETQTATTPTVNGDVYRITSSDGVNLRSGYGTSHPVLGGITYGQDVTVTKVKKNEGYTWGCTTYNGVTGWFVTDFAKLIYKKTSESETTQTNPSVPKATTAPTVAPTVKPTTAPVVKPTTAPVVKPTVAPVVKPTAPPTQPPTQKPTEAIVEVTEPDTTVRMLMMGDMDSDDELTIMDATRIQLVVAELLIPTEYMMIVGDYDGDSILSIMDAARIRFFLAYEAA